MTSTNVTIPRDVYDRLRDLIISYARDEASQKVGGQTTVDELRDQAARKTKASDNPFEARKQRIEWRAASELEKLRGALQFVIDGYPRIDINHQDYRVEVYRVALDAMGLSLSQAQRDT